MQDLALTIPDLDMELRGILPGIFRRLSGPQTGAPAATVRLTQPFFLATRPVTQAQYRRLMRASPSYFQGDPLPVECVSWHDCFEFCQRLTAWGRQAGRIGPGQRFRLPTEAEWEYACRSGEPDGSVAGDPAGFPFTGEAARLIEFAWFDGNADGTTHPVGERKPNAWGLHDMLGNVGEWCQDWWAPPEPQDLTDPTGPRTGERRVRRGGCWASCARRCRPADRLGVLPECRCALIGFRVALAPAAADDPDEPPGLVW